MVFERATQFPTPEDHSGSARCRARRTASASWPASSGCAPRTTSTASLHDLPPVQRLRPGRDARRRAGHRARRAGPDQEVHSRCRPTSRCRSSATARTRGRSPTSTTSPTGSSRRWPRRRRRHEDFNVSASEELTVAEIARVIWEATGRDPDAFSLAHLPSFEVDVVRRWPSVEGRALLGWQARIGVRDGIGQTVEWLRGVVGAAQP